ncbi:calmodulin-regulated spectrin-associated protein 1-B-like isoform X2 [Dysidea avara]|uniref:calmodulin-regulated spectrin-associated protein 1-B-like isoform X2 n=1 Tax=Dysidea avara TaxID=196820 RepID=UPI0033320C5F
MASSASSFHDDVLKASFHWLSQQLSEEAHGTSITLLQSPTEAEQWKHDLLHQLTTPPSIYCAVVDVITSNTLDDHQCSFQYVFKVLARKGVFLDECDDMIVTETTLANFSPFNILAHQTLINAIMKLYITASIAIPSVICEIRRIASFTPSKELPTSSNEALLLWIRKICSCNITKFKKESSLHTLPAYFTSSDVIEVVKDGQSLAQLLLYYFPNNVKWSDFHWSLSQLSEDKSLHNLTVVNTMVSLNTPVKCHIDPHLMLLNDHVVSNTTTITALQFNVLVFLSTLFVYVKQSYLLTSESSKKPSSESFNSRVSPGNILSKRKEIQKGVLSASKPPSRYLARRNSSDVLMHALSDSSLCQNHGSLSSTPSSVSLIDYNKRSNVEKPNNGYSDLTGDSGSKYIKQQITASSENLKMAQFESHTSLRLKRPPSGRMPKECFEDNATKLATHGSAHTSYLTSVSSTTSINSDSETAQCFNQKEDKSMEKFENSLLVNHSRNLSNDHQFQPTAIIADPSSYQWLLKTLALHGVTLETDPGCRDKEQDSIQEATLAMNKRCHTADGLRSEGTQKLPHVYRVNSANESLQVSRIARLNIKHVPNSTPSLYQDDSTKAAEVSSGEVVNSAHEQDNFNHTSDEVTPESISDSTFVKPATQQNLQSREYSGNNLESSNIVVAQTANTVDIPGSDNGACDDAAIADKTYSLSSESCSDVADIDQVTDSDATQLQTVQLDVFPEEEMEKPESQPARTSDDNMQLVAMACYETVMEMVKCDDSLPLDSDKVKSHDSSGVEKLQQSKPVSLDIFLEEETRIPQPKLSRPQDADANMQHVAMVCYETVMEMVRSDDILSSFMSDSQHDGNNISAHPPLLEKQHLHNQQKDSQDGHVAVHHSDVVNIMSSHDGDVTKQVDHPSNVQPSSQAKQHSEGGDNVELLLSDDDTVDSLQQVVVTDVRSNTDGGLLQAMPRSQVAVTENMTPSDKYDATVVVNKKPPQGSSYQPKDSVSASPFSVFIDISDSKDKEQQLRVLESRRQKIKMHLMERDRARTKKKDRATHKQDLGDSQSLQTARMDSVQRTVLKDAGNKNSQPLVTTSEEGHVLHFTLGAHPTLPSPDVPNIVNIASSTIPTIATTSQPVAVPYSGPQCYVQPSIKSNKKIISNAISHICLAGAVNTDARQKVIQILDNSPANNFLVLFRDQIGCKFRGIYICDDEKVLKIYGAGPKVVTNSMISRVFKYNSGTREFHQIPSARISKAIDAFTLHHYIWELAKSKKQNL